MSPPSIQADEYNCPKLLLYKFSPTISRQNKLSNDEPLLFLMRGVNTGLYAAHSSRWSRSLFYFLGCLLAAMLIKKKKKTVPALLMCCKGLPHGEMKFEGLI